MACTSDVSRLAIPEREQRVTIWDVASEPPRMQRTLEGHTASVTDVAWSPGGTWSASGGLGGTVRVYALRLEKLAALAWRRLTRSLTDDECRPKPAQHQAVTEAPFGLSISSFPPRPS